MQNRRKTLNFPAGGMTEIMNVAFKEWAVVCEALGDGRQCVILRKGGIAEGRAGFAFQHGNFFLFPTWFHEQLAKTILPDGTALPGEDPDGVVIRYAAALEWTLLVGDLERLRRLREFHILHDSVVEERFHYDGKAGVHVAFVRVFRLDPPRHLDMEKNFGGCRSWIELPEFGAPGLIPVVGEEEHRRRDREIQKALAGG